MCINMNDIFENLSWLEIMIIVLFLSSLCICWEMKKLAQPKPIDKGHVKKRIAIRFFSTFILSGWIAYYSNIKLENNTLTLNRYCLILIILLCYFNGIRWFYNKIGPTFSVTFIKSLQSNFGVYLRCFANDSNEQINNCEEYICKMLKRRIPIYAIGNPFEVLPANGATRIYATDTEWEEAVKHMIDKSTFVLIKPSDTPGCLKELFFCKDMNALNKTIFILHEKKDIQIIKEKLGLTINHSDLKFIDNILLGRYVGNNFILKEVNNEVVDKDLLAFIVPNINNDINNITWVDKMFNRLTFILNPLLYASMHEWNLAYKVLVTYIMASPFLWSILYKNTQNNLVLLIFTLSFFIGLILFCVSPTITRKNKVYISSAHYNHENSFMILLNAFTYIQYFIIFAINNYKHPDNSVKQIPGMVMSTIKEFCALVSEFIVFLGKGLYYVILLIYTCLQLLFLINPIISLIILCLVISIIYKTIRLFRRK